MLAGLKIAEHANGILKYFPPKTGLNISLEHVFLGENWHEMGREIGVYRGGGGGGDGGGGDGDGGEGKGARESA